jgi:lysophospholipase L1-like esterase
MTASDPAGGRAIKVTLQTGIDDAESYYTKSDPAGGRAIKVKLLNSGYKSSLVPDDSIVTTEVNGTGLSYSSNMSDVKNYDNGATTWISPRGISEYAGNAEYAPIQNWAYGTYIQVKSVTRLKRIKAYYRQLNVSSTVAPIVEIRVYRSMTLLNIPSGDNFPSQSTLVQSNLYYKGQFNTVAGAAQTINLENEITLAANEYLYVYVYAHQGCNIGVRRWTTNSSTLPDRQLIWYNTDGANNTPTNWFNTIYKWGASGDTFRTVPLILEADYADSLNTLKSDIVTAALASVPSVIYVTAGRELNIWTESLFPFTNGLGLSVQYICANKGYITDRGFRFTPVNGDVGNYSLTINIYDVNLKLIDTKTITITVGANNNTTSAKNILVFGDSLVFNAGTTELVNLFAADSGIAATFIGTRGTGSGLMEGRPGWSFADFAGTSSESYYRFNLTGVTTYPTCQKDTGTTATTFTLGNGSTYTCTDVYLTGGGGTGSGYIICQKNSGTFSTAAGTLTKNTGTGDSTYTVSSAVAVNKSPFYNNTANRIDLQNYVSVNSLSAPDMIVVQLGVNDSFSATPYTQRQIDDIANTARILVDGLRNANGYPNAKIVISLPPFGAAGNNGFGYNYGAANSPEAFKYNLRGLYIQLINIFSGNNYSTNVRVSASGLWVDRINGYPTLSDFALTPRPISARSNFVVTAGSTETVLTVGAATINSIKPGQTLSGNGFTGTIISQLTGVVGGGGGLATPSTYLISGGSVVAPWASCTVTNTENTLANGVHPKASGYNQISDAIYSILRSFY